MNKKLHMSGLMAALIAAFGLTMLPACGDDSAGSAASKPPVQQRAAKEDKDPLAAAQKQFTEVVKAAGYLKQQVDLCFFDTGSLVSCNDSQKGIGWDLKRAAEDTADQHIAGVSVKNGTITLTSRGMTVKGKDSFSLILVPASLNGNNIEPITWKIDPASTCLAAGLCMDEKTARKAKMAEEEKKDPIGAARKKFSPVSSAASLFKMQVELCFFDTGSLTNCNDGQKGTGWNLKRAAEDAADEYLAGVSVRNGLITLTSRGISLNGKDAFSLILVPEVSKEDKFGALKWKIDASSTCLAAGLCEDEKTRNARQEEKAVKEDKDPLATARRRFKDLGKQANFLRQQVYICFLDIGGLTGKNAQGNAASCSDDQKGTAWDLQRAVADATNTEYKYTDYVAGASVKNGVITLTSRGITAGGKDSFSLILTPADIKKDKFDTTIIWKVDPASTCLSAGICDETFAK